MVFGDSVNFTSVTVDSVDLEESYETGRQTPLFSHTATITGTLPPMVVKRILIIAPPPLPRY